MPGLWIKEVKKASIEYFENTPKEEQMEDLLSINYKNEKNIEKSKHNYSQEDYDVLMFRFKNHEEIICEDRRHLKIGPIRINRIQCNYCFDIITSENAHDFKWCKCKTVAVDGGSWSRNRNGKREDFLELSKPYRDLTENQKILY
jgi:hypothetical protein